MTVVLDASAMIDWLLGRLGGEAAADLERPPDEGFVAPTAFRYEVGQYFRHAPHNGELTVEQATAAMEIVADFGIELVDVPVLDAWQHVGRLSWGDAEHIALTLSLDGGVLWTTDARLTRSGVLTENQHRLLV
jgi:predicted nucleic acid-binding protein